MNRRTFNKYLLAAPIALATLLTSRPTSSVVRKKEKSEELGQKEESIKELLEKKIKQILIDWDNDFEKKAAIAKKPIGIPKWLTKEIG